MIKKIVVIGPESTGKSTLCEQLAQYYNTLWVPEYAREYLHEKGTKYTYEDLLTIAKGQIALEEKYINLVSTIVHAAKNTTSPLLFIDTNMYVMKVWCEFVYSKCHQWILDQIVERQYDFYLLCNIDLPWVEDELREYPDVSTRHQLYNIYRDILVNQNISWAEISGASNERLQKTIDVINKFFLDCNRNHK